MNCPCKEHGSFNTHQQKAQLLENCWRKGGKVARFYFLFSEAELPWKLDHPCLVPHSFLLAGGSLASSYQSNRPYFISFLTCSWILSHPWRDAASHSRYFSQALQALLFTSATDYALPLMHHAVSEPGNLIFERIKGGEREGDTPPESRFKKKHTLKRAG